MATESVNVTELRRHLSGWLERARSGEHILITSRGVVIAELSPPVASPDEVEEARARLRNSLLRYDRPFDPVLDPGTWDDNA